MPFDISVYTEGLKAVISAFNVVRGAIERLRRKKDNIEKDDLLSVVDKLEEIRKGLELQKEIGRMLLKYSNYYAESHALYISCDKILEGVRERKESLKNDKSDLFEHCWLSILTRMSDFDNSMSNIYLMKTNKFRWLTDDDKKTLLEFANQFSNLLEKLKGKIKDRDRDVDSIERNLIDLCNLSSMIKTTIFSNLEDLIDIVCFGEI